MELELVLTPADVLLHVQSSLHAATTPMPLRSPWLIFSEGQAEGLGMHYCLVSVMPLSLMVIVSPVILPLKNGPFMSKSIVTPWTE